MEIGKKALSLILGYEGLDQPSKWPGFSSGVTIGRGYDLGFEKSFREDWKGLLDDKTINRLAKAYGIKGEAAKALSKQFKDITIKQSQADQVFHDHTLPKYISWTVQAFPNSDKLPPEAFGALVSIVFNRGPLVDNSDRRREMKAIRDILAKNPKPDKETLKQIAAQVESMARLWADNKNSDGDLHDRRIAEANLIRSAI